MPTEPITPNLSAPSPVIPARLRTKIAEQGVADTATFEHLLGLGKDLWADDAEFEQFLETVRATRSERE